MKQEIIDNITKMAGTYAPEIVFSDWVNCSAIAIQNGCYLFDDYLRRKREQEYLSISKRYSKKDMIAFGNMLAMLAIELTEYPKDVLGEIYMKLGAASKQTGQFFTPYHLSELAAKLATPDDISPENPFIVNEPSVGGGGMVIAMAEQLKSSGVNYQTCMKVIAQDLDYRSVYMSYVQFSLLGIDAVVVQGDALSEPYKAGYPQERVWKTPKRMGLIL